MKEPQKRQMLRLPPKITDVEPEYRKVASNVEMHCHDFYEIEVVVSGTGTQVLNGKPYQLRRGCVTLLSPLDFHIVTPTHNDLWVYNFMFRDTMLSPKLLQSVWAYGGNKFLYFEGEDLQEIISICKLLELEHKKQSEERAFLMKNLMECFFVLLLQALHHNAISKQTDMPDEIQSSIQYLHQNFRQNPSLTQTAAAVNWHPNYFSRRFRELTGQTYTAYLTKLKLDYAKKLLLSSQQSVTEICYASGFASLSNFMRIFKENTGTSPLRYIEAHGKPPAAQS